MNYSSNSKSAIAIVDTGVRASHKCLNGAIAGGIGVQRRGDSLDYIYDSDFDDRHGHGTGVASLLHMLAPETPLYAVRIAQQQKIGYSIFVQEKVLALGIEWCLQKNIRLINLSYSIEEAPDNGPLADACRKAHAQNTILVAAYRNGEKRPVYPSAFPTVIGVAVLPNSEHGEISILSEKNYDVAVYGGPYQVASLDQTFRVMCGTSLATAQVTGMVARMLTIKPQLTLKQVFVYLKKYAI